MEEFDSDWNAALASVQAELTAKDKRIAQLENSLRAAGGYEGDE